MARHEVCLEADLSLLDAHSEPVPGQENRFQLYGNTRDLSEAGVLLIVPLIPIDEGYCRMEDRTLPLTVYLPEGQVDMEVTPVRCQPVDEREPSKGFLMGAEITGIDETGRTRLRKYLRSISARTNPETSH
ncbi:MAG: PilZ domain-containing protein [Acidobacteriota bacterium]|nr:PilZ domain-containing protein [Acidobacteriota bacterium]